MTSSPRFTTVLFDLDGTLVDTIPLIVASYQHAFRTVTGEEVEDARARAWIGRPLLDALLEESPEHGHELDRVYREWNLANTQRLIRPYAAVPELLDALASAGVTTGIVTSKRRETAHLALASVGLEDRIEVAAGLEDTEAHKPDAAPLRHGMQVLGLDPSDPATLASTAYVGDATVDVLAARAAGLTPIAVTWGAGERESLEATGPATVATTMGELAAYLGVGL